MSLPLDHIVIAVHDLQQAIDDYRSLGFTVTPGGDHPGRATHNALVVFQDGSYLELIAWKVPETAHPWWPKLSRFGAGIVDFALLPSTTHDVVAKALSRGLVYQPPVDGGRVRPDGVELRWQNARPATPDLPFLCGDVTPRTLRVPEGLVREHANGVQGVARLHVAVHDVSTTLERYSALLDLDDIPFASEGAVKLRLGSTVLQLDTAITSPAAAQRLALQGEGLYAISLHTKQSRFLGHLQHGNTHGTHLELIAYPDPISASSVNIDMQTALT